MEADDLGHFILIYKKFAAAENKSDRTIEAVTNAVSKFNIFLGDARSPQDIQADDLRQYILHLQQQCRWAGHPTIGQNHGNLSPHTIASYVRSIRSLWSWLEREQFIEINPFSQVKPPKVPVNITDPLNPEEVSKLLKIIPRNEYRGYRETCIILTLYGTGLRISELLNLKLLNVDFNSGQIKVMGKGAKERSVFMSPKNFKALMKYHTIWRPNIATDHFFVHEDGRKLTRTYMEHRIQAFTRQANITKKCTPHIFRYSFSIQFLRNGGDPFTLQKILGHSTIDMTRRYVQIASTDVERNMKSYSPAEQLDIRL